MAELVDRWMISGSSWHLAPEVVAFFDWRQILKRRREALAYLARYGRQDVLRWRSRPIPEVEAFVMSVAELVRSENATSKVEEI